MLQKALASGRISRLEKAEYRLSTIDLQRSAADESGRLAAQEGNDLPEIRRVTCEQAVRSTAYCREPVRRVISGTRQIERNAVLPQILRGGLRPGPQPRTCRVAQRQRGHRLFYGRRGYQADPAPPAGRHVRYSRPDQPHHRQEVVIERLPHRRIIDLQRAHRGRPAAIADEYVEAAEATNDRLDQVARSAGVSDIGHDRVNGPACRRDFLCRTLERIPAPSADDDVHALSGKRDGTGPPQTLR